MNDGGIDIFLSSTQKPRHITKKEIEKSWEHLATTGIITRAIIKDVFRSENSAYIVALLAKLPGVIFHLDPIELRIKE